MTPNLSGLTGMTKLTGDLKRAPRARKEKKVKDSAIGIGIMVLSVPIWGVTAYLAFQPSPSLAALGGGAVLGALVLAFGALAADRETFMPVLQGMVRLAVKIIKARKA